MKVRFYALSTLLMLTAAVTTQAAEVGDRLTFERGQVQCTDVPAVHRRKPCSYCYDIPDSEAYGAVMVTGNVDGVKTFTTEVPACADLEAALAKSQSVGFTITHKDVRRINDKLTLVVIDLKLDSDRLSLEVSGYNEN